jgi:hypothetical protein
MKFWGIFSKTLFKLFAGKAISKLRRNSIEDVLARSVMILDSQTIIEIKSFIKDQQTSTGGFADRGGNSDLYYSLFGCYVAEALGIDEIKPMLKEYVIKVISAENLSGVNLKCALILHAKLFGDRTLPSHLLRNDTLTAQYADFINMLAYYYSEDFISLYRVMRKLKARNTSTELPCSVTAANLIIRECTGKNYEEPWKQMQAFYRNGSFLAFSKAPLGDLLSTGVALYALRFAGSDMSLIKPDCLMYIDLLYSCGGFCATTIDMGPDVEYTFYGLLALGSLSD